MENFINEILDELLPALSIDANSGLARPIAQAILHDKISNRLEQLVMPMLTDFVERHGKDCPACPNQGSYAITTTHRRPSYDGDRWEEYPGQEQEQCRFCCTEPDSKYYMYNELKELLNASKHSA